MGSDASPALLWEGVLCAKKLLPSDVELNVFASPDFCCSVIPSPNIFLTSAAEVIRMDQEPMYAIRRQHDSSLVKALKEHAAGVSQAVVTCGNTGALMLGSRLFFPSFSRSIPALLVNIPTVKGIVTLLDVGGNLYPNENHLCHFAEMGALYCKAIRGIFPKLALLNIGKETMKGSTVYRRAYDLMKSSDQKNYLFLGNMEARDIFHEDVDVVVCDGFSGNLVLKTAEGISLFMLERIQNIIKDITSEQSKEFTKIFNYLEYPGGFVCGVKGHLVKCHGNGAPEAFAKSILYAYELARQNVSAAIARQI